MNKWQPIETAPKDGREFLTRNNRQGGVKSLVSWNTIHNYWQSKGEPILSLQDTHWIEIPEFIQDCTYDCDKCGKSFVDVLYHKKPQLFLCPSCKKEWDKRDLLDLLREYRYAYEQCQNAGRQEYDLEELNKKQLEILDKFEEVKISAATSNFCSAEWKNDFDKVNNILNKIKQAVEDRKQSIIEDRDYPFFNIIEDLINED